MFFSNDAATRCRSRRGRRPAVPIGAPRPRLLGGRSLCRRQFGTALCWPRRVAECAYVDLSGTLSGGSHRHGVAAGRQPDTAMSPISPAPLVSRRLGPAWWSCGARGTAWRRTRSRAPRGVGHRYPGADGSAHARASCRHIRHADLVDRSVGGSPANAAPDEHDAIACSPKTRSENCAWLTTVTLGCSARFLLQIVPDLDPARALIGTVVRAGRSRWAVRFPRPCTRRGCSRAPVEVRSCPVVAHGGARVRVAGGDLTSRRSTPASSIAVTKVSEHVRVRSAYPDAG